MKYFSTDKIGRIFILSLHPGDYILESIKELVEKESVKDAIVVSAIGTLDEYEMHYVLTTGFPPQNKFEHWKDKPLELAHIGGIIADGEPHLHVVVSDSEKAYAGHLEKGCRVLYLAEIVIIEVKGLNLKRIRGEDRIQRLTRIS
ncbi:DUF296 domain-containing protein [Candidatus Bathyarchaeota archaeon]|nr:MAG: DUF296 domain-containing protein [Candidatus Bathyarchaeota archaeon]